MKKLYVYFSVTMMLLLTLKSAAQNESQSFIFGDIYTVEGETIEGFIRWGKEEVYWSDFLNATKRYNPYLQYLTKEDRRFIESGENKQSNWLGDLISEAIDIDGQYLHSFACRFGDVESIKAAGGNSIEVKLKRGGSHLFKTGSNDLGATLHIFDKSGKERSIEWDRVDQVRFKAVPNDWTNPYKGPLWGKIETIAGTFVGQIQWDHDERCGWDVLDGDVKDKDLSIPFADIKVIAREGRGSYVILKDGSELFLSGSNDVNEGNRGIIVNIPSMGRIDVPWEEFIKVSFLEENPPLPAYTEFIGSRKLKGSVKTSDGASFSGEIVYDLDEAYTYEVLNGRQELSEWEIPFEFIQSIQPKNYKYSTVKLKSGEVLLIGRMQDVSESNSGILVFTSPEKTTYIPWERVLEIIFQ